MSQIEQVLCPIDVSPIARQAAKQAAAIASYCGASLHVLHVAQPIALPIPVGVGHGPVTWRETDRPTIRCWMEERVQDAVERGTDAEIEIASGRPATEILATAVTCGADLIVMGSHGASGIERALLGSVAEEVLRRSTTPVLIVPAGAAIRAELPFSRVLCAVDFSSCALRGVEYALGSPLCDGAELLLAHVLEWPWEEPPAPALEELPATEAAALASYRRRREEDARRRLERLRPEGFAGRCRPLVVHGRSHVELLHLAADEQADLIVVGLRGRRAIDRAMFGSTTNHLVRRAKCPVLTICH